MHTKALLFRTILIALIVYSLPLTANDNDFKELLRARIESSQAGSPLIVNNRPLYNQTLLANFYFDRLFKSAWFKQGELTQSALELIGSLAQAEEEGLSRENYHWAAINNLKQSLNNNNLSNQIVKKIDLELLLSDAFFTYGSHLLQGRVNPDSLEQKWDTARRENDLNSILSTALEGNTVANTVTNLKPKHQGYHQLLKALTYYRKIAKQGGWNIIPGGEKLNEGKNNPRVIQLKQRLIITEDYHSDSAKLSPLFDQNLRRAVQYFQTRHGLQPDGVVGPATLQALNVSADERVQQILANLERWRWLPADLGLRHIMVNIAGFELALIDNNKTVLQMPVVVGKTYRETPVFTGRMTYVVVNPTWNVPPSIAGKDKLPLLIKNPGYLSKHNMKLYRGWGANAEEIDPYSIDWSKINPKHFPYRIVQQSGKGNVLGKIKFMLPNEHDVYLHDTSEPWLFNKTERTFSSGCIRLSKPLVLADYVLNDNTRLSQEKIKEIFDQEKEKTIVLKQAIPVYILYWTAWVDDAGVVNFRKDIYNRDKKLLDNVAKAIQQMSNLKPV